MDREFWHNRWISNRLGFHLNEVNPSLRSHFSKLSLKTGDRIFVPLSGKTRDISWLRSMGLQVVGVELIEIAVQQLFEELGTDPKIEQIGPLRRYSTDDQTIQVYAGDVFDLRAEILGPVSATYDRAALVALPRETRRAYSRQIVKITRGAPQLLLAFEYNQEEQPGPPFSLSKSELKELYCPPYDLIHLEEFEVPGGLKGSCSARETIWHLHK